MNTKFETRKSENQTQAFQIMDCSNNKKLVLKKVGGFLTLAVLDDSENINGILTLRLKKPYAKNFAKLTQAILPLNRFIVEKIEILSGGE
jgi:hypothetical protein